MKIYTATERNHNTVADLISVMKQADQDTIVRNEKGSPLSAYIDVVTGEIVIVEDDD